MANAVHCVTNELLKNNFYYDLSTASASNPTQLPSSDTGLADSGASGFYFAPDAHVANINSRAPAIRVEVVNGLPVRSIAAATLEGFYESFSTPGLWRHKWRPLQFSLIVDYFGVEYVGIEHFNFLLDILKKYHGVQFNMAGDKLAGITIT
jgi:hypothetical protein